MSLGFEMMAAMPDEYLGDEPYEAYDSRPSRPITHWKTWNGKVIAIKDMTTLHLDNTIKFLKNKITFPETTVGVMPISRQWKKS